MIPNQFKKIWKKDVWLCGMYHLNKGKKREEGVEMKEMILEQAMKEAIIDMKGMRDTMIIVMKVEAQIDTILEITGTIMTDMIIDRIIVILIIDMNTEITGMIDMRIIDQEIMKEEIIKGVMKGQDMNMIITEKEEKKERGHPKKKLMDPKRPKSNRRVSNWMGNFLERE